MRAAFYTPLKHPDLREPSGDREIARSLMLALSTCGLEPELASQLSTWRRAFDPAEAERLERRAALVAAMLIRRFRRRPPDRRPRLWLTYQNYHRCPDLLGPPVAAALDIPYVLVETSVSTKSRGSPFRPWLAAARLAVRQADVIFAMSPRDLPRLAGLRGPRFADTRLRLLPPAVDVRRYEIGAEPRAPGHDEPVLLCVAMMRTVDKLDSYRLLAQALARLHARRPDRPWRLVVVGDGPARPAVEAALAPLPPERVRLRGVLEPAALPPVYRSADVFAFPGIGDALGLVYLEAAAAGLPVVACEGPGPAAMVAPGGGLLTEPDPDAFADALARLLDDPATRRQMGATARRFVSRERTPEAFVRTLRAGLALVLPSDGLGGGGASR